MSKVPSLSQLLNSKKWPRVKDNDEEIRQLQLLFLRIQQGIWHSKSRAILVFEGFDAAGKGGAIRRLTEKLDPRGVRVHAIGAPDPGDQAKHYLYRFWKLLPEPGTIAIFDRSWYGRVLVERVHELAPKKRWKEAYSEIRSFESMLQDDGIELVKIFIGIGHDEQLRRFADRLKDPYKQWKLTKEDVRDSALFREFVRATDDLFKETHTQRSPWHLVAGNDKDYARAEVLKIANQRLRGYGKWMESKAVKQKRVGLKEALHELEAKS